MHNSHRKRLDSLMNSIGVVMGKPFPCHQAASPLIPFGFPRQQPSLHFPQAACSPTLRPRPLPLGLGPPWTPAPRSLIRCSLCSSLYPAPDDDFSFYNHILNTNSLSNCCFSLRLTILWKRAIILTLTNYCFRMAFCCSS